MNRTDMIGIFWR